MIIDVLYRIQSPLITLMASSEMSNFNELNYVILSHIQFIASNSDIPLFSYDYKRFYCKNDEPSYI